MSMIKKEKNITCKCFNSFHVYYSFLIFLQNHYKNESIFHRVYKSCFHLCIEYLEFDEKVPVLSTFSQRTHKTIT